MASRTRHAHRPECTTAFRRAAKSLESWVLSDFGRLSMTSRSPQILHQQPPQAPTETPQSPTSPLSWTIPVTAIAAYATPFPQSIFPAPSYAPPPTPRGHADWTPDPFSPGHISRPRQPSTSSTMSSVSSTSSFGSAASSIDDLDQLPDYNTSLKHQGAERIKPFLNDNREVSQALREVEGGDFEGEDEGRVTGGKKRWRQ